VRKKRSESALMFAERVKLDRLRKHPGQVMFAGRWRTRREAFEWIRNMREWRGAKESEDLAYWILRLGSAELRFKKVWP
jgi:hypothetical protein